MLFIIDQGGNTVSCNNKKMSTRFLAEGLMGHRELQLCITNKCVEKKKERWQDAQEGQQRWRGRDVESDK